ncbi:single-stranded-DNA-specific exonuclease RecJ [Motilimonas cestriensis]|uniref:Single-stranded-DNA-specific exonuclease RecJ n=1 Tax=Motilimonas cestriensis TaxID=2742685 RepID=A0ABS8WAQ4_9GAMM|nr:single-stranded-DNA-specific exonuclease RecJ [Motilimonas cestriensis]MCE2594485.1 single-stranded-DNA-specific exonuclease RecJ [Motilimonas cestriensis]
MPKLSIQRRDPVDASFLPDELHPVLKQIYANRGIKDASELNMAASALFTPKDIMGIDRACELLYQAINAKQRIIIVGDFDADGATSTALCVLALKMLGCTNVDFLVPNRFDYGYGLSPETVQLAADMGAAMIVTVDNGISSIQGVSAAKALGLQVVVTDHHLPGLELPNADAIVNPNQHGCGFPSKNLAGVGVAFYLMLALRQYISQRDGFHGTPPNLACLLDIVALGTVADVVPLDANNRILVHQGIGRIRAGRCRPGIQALIEVAGKNQQQLVASDLGFALGPRINAAGRLDEMSLGVSLLLCDDLPQARSLAVELDTLNRERREIETGMQQEAINSLQKIELDESDIPTAICLYQEDWHQGVIGLVASRIKERYYRPTLAFASAGEGEIKGSARSIPGIHMRDMLDQVDTQNPGLIHKFGGHAMAAGLSLPLAHFADFKAKLNQVIDQHISPSVLQGSLLSDGPLAPQAFNLELAQLLKFAGPWGQAFPEPLFDGKFKLLQQRLVGQKHLKLVLEPEAGGVAIDAIAFNVDLALWPNPMVRWAEIAYRLDINEFRGNRSVQLMVDLINPL